MSYKKPEIIVLGEANKMIAYTSVKAHLGILEAIAWCINPAYDLDE